MAKPQIASVASQDYLEQIYHLIEQKGSDLAKHVIKYHELFPQLLRHFSRDKKTIPKGWGATSPNYQSKR